MNLVISLSNPNILPETLRTRRVEFGQGGGLIGRSDDCDWVLDDPDRFVSSRHLRVGFKRKQFTLEDISTNGTYLNDELIGKGNKRPVKTGDTIRIGRFIMTTEVRDKDGSVIGEVASDPFDLAGAPAADTAAAEPADALLSGRRTEGDELIKRADETDSIDDFIGGAPAPAASDDLGLGATPADHAPGVSAALPAMRQAESGGAIPADWNLDEAATGHAQDGGVDLIPDTPAAVDAPPVADIATQEEDDLLAPATPPADPAPMPAPVAPVAAGMAAPVIPAPAAQAPLSPAPAAPPAPVVPDIPQTTAEDFASAFLAELRLGAQEATPENGAAFAAVMREMLEGTISLLQSRANMRTELRLRGTMVGARENNPLKFSVNHQDALVRLLRGEELGFMAPVPAAREVMQELLEHQLAMLEGIDAGKAALLDALDPATVPASKQGILGAPALAKALVERHKSVAEDATERSGGVFWRAFTKAYQSAAAELKSKLARAGGR